MLASIARSGTEIPAIAFGLTAATFYLAELLGAPWFGAMSDRVGRRRFLIIGPICGMVAVQLIGWPNLTLAFPLLLLPLGVGRMTEGLSTAVPAAPPPLTPTPKVKLPLRAWPSTLLTVDQRTV